MTGHTSASALLTRVAGTARLPAAAPPWAAGLGDPDPTADETINDHAGRAQTASLVVGPFPRQQIV